MPNPSPDSLAILLLCSHLGLGTDPNPAPLTLREWNPLARSLLSAGLRPESLLGLDAAGLRSALGLEEEMAQRVLSLLGRRPQLEQELGRVQALGMHPLTRADLAYPARYRQRLKDAAPSVLFYAGEPTLLGQPGIAVVGSRNLDEAGQACAEFVGQACGLSGLVLYSGGARGVDIISMTAALTNRGTAVGILADSLEKALKNPAYKASLGRGDLCLATPYSPNAPFSVGAAMGRNRLIYTLADHAIVVASDFEKGGTWGGASEALKNHWLPVYVLEHADMPEGNRRLIQKGGLPFPHPFPGHFLKLKTWLDEHAAPAKPEAAQPGLF